MKLHNTYLIIQSGSYFFGVKFKSNINKYYPNNDPIRKCRISSSRDNSTMFIQEHIIINVCDLDVELNKYLCAEALIL